MIGLAAVVGALSGLILALAMYRSGMLQERSGLAILLGAIAFFYPVFAATEGDWPAFTLHVLVFAAFSFLALQGWTKGIYLIVGGLIAHGLFDFGLAFIGHPGPVWWPIFCGTLDVIIGLIVLRLLQVGKVPA